MPKIIVIAAIGQNNELGLNNQLLWYLPNDLKRFKSLTTGHPILMGRKTYESIGKPLPNRRNIIISKQLKNSEGLEVFESLKHAFKALEQEEKVYVIGGGQVYKEALDKFRIDVLEITRVFGCFEADTFFPDIDLSKWKETFKETHYPDEKHGFKYEFVTLELC
jgi:dihydrofolate reductase